MTHDLTRLLQALHHGQEGALDELVAATQQELRRVAFRHLSAERVDHTLQATALVNEAYIRLVDQRERNWQTKQQFMAIASTAMRRVLLEHARARVAQKRGGDNRKVTLFEASGALEEEPQALIALDEALVEFAQIDPRGASIVELRWFGGLEVPEVAATLGVSARTVERGWRAASAWLRARVGGAC